MTSVTLRKRDNGKGKIYLYLDYYPGFFDPITMKTKRHEYLGIHLHSKPITPMERTFNENMLDRAKAIRDKRALEIVNNEYGFLDKDRLEYDFINYFENIAHKKHIKWIAAVQHFKRFIGAKECRFKHITVSLCEKFKDYLLNEAENRQGGKLGNNSASAYYCLFRSALKQAYVDGILEKNINDYLTEIKTKKVQKDYLSIEEVKRLNATVCQSDVVKRASMFSIFTGLRMSDILNLQWNEIKEAPDGGHCIEKIIQKSDRHEVVYISEEALEFCGKRSIGTVFRGLNKSLIYSTIPQWVRAAGIDKHITFHCFRHTNATLMLTAGVDIYTISKMLTHSNVSTTQIYAEVVDSKKREASNVITLKDAIG